MYGIIKQRGAYGALGGSSASILAESLKWIWTVVSKPRSYTSTGKGALVSGREFKHVRSISDHLFLGGPTCSNPIREETLVGMPSRQFSSYNAEKESQVKNCLLEIRKRLILPSPPAIELTSSEGELMHIEALDEGNLEGFFPLLNSYLTQSEAGFYGVTSISTVLNALEATSKKKRKRRWRWFYEYLVDYCDSFEMIKAVGLTFGKLAFLAHCNGANVEVFMTNQCTIDEFRNQVMKCATSKDHYMVAFFDRAHFNQMGASHISPIGGYHAGRDMILIEDIARHEYPPFWIPVMLLWKAMDTIDEATRHHMGFMVISRLPYDPSILYTLSCRDESWTSTANYLTQIPLILKLEDIKDIQQILSVVFTSSRTTNFGQFIKRVTEVKTQENGASRLSRIEKKRLTLQEELLKQVRETELFKHVSNWLDSRSSHSVSKIAANFCYRSPGSSSRLYCTDTAESSKANDEMLTTEVSGPVVACNTEEGGAGTMVQSTHTSPSGSGSSNDIEMDLASDDVLTMLLLSLPPHTWSGIKEVKLLTEINNLVSMDNAPPLLKNEVLSLRQQLQLLMIDLGSPPT